MAKQQPPPCTTLFSEANYGLDSWHIGSLTMKFRILRHILQTQKLEDTQATKTWFCTPEQTCYIPLYTIHESKWIPLDWNYHGSKTNKMTLKKEQLRYEQPCNPKWSKTHMQTSWAACHMIGFIWSKRVNVRAYFFRFTAWKCEDLTLVSDSICLLAKNNRHWWVQPHDAQGWFNVSSLSTATIAGCENCERSSPFFGSGLRHLLITDKGCPSPLRGVCENPFYLRRHIKKIIVHSRTGLCARLPLPFARRTFHGLPEIR